MGGRRRSNTYHIEFRVELGSSGTRLMTTLLQLAAGAMAFKQGVREAGWRMSRSSSVCIEADVDGYGFQYSTSG
jgi:hypothetical protein